MQKGALMAAETFTVRVNRLILLFLGLVSALFFRVGLDGAFVREWLNWNFPPGISWQFIAFCFFFLGCGGLIALNCLWYFIRPPVMLRFDEKGVTFGTGFRYRPHTIAWKHVEKIGYGAEACVTLKAQLFAGAAVVFRDDPGVPAFRAVSMGLGYSFRRLTLHWLYADRLPWTIVREGKSIFKKYTSEPCA